MKLQVKSKRAGLGAGGVAHVLTPAGGNATCSGDDLKAEGNIRAGPASGMCASVCDVVGRAGALILCAGALQEP